MKMGKSQKLCAWLHGWIRRYVQRDVFASASASVSLRFQTWREVSKDCSAVLPRLNASTAASALRLTPERLRASGLFQLRSVRLWRSSRAFCAARACAGVPRPASTVGRTVELPARLPDTWPYGVARDEPVGLATTRPRGKESEVSCCELDAALSEERRAVRAADMRLRAALSSAVEMLGRLLRGAGAAATGALDGSLPTALVAAAAG